MMICPPTDSNTDREQLARLLAPPPGFHGRPSATQKATPNTSRVPEVVVYSSWSNAGYDHLLQNVKANLYQGNVAHILSPTLKSLRGLYDLGANWNGYNVEAPNPDAIELAIHWTQAFYNQIVAENYEWRTPHVSANQDGNVVLEWLQEGRNLSVFVTPRSAWYLKASDGDTMDDMEDGDINSDEDNIQLWSWLATGSAPHAG